MDTLYDCYSFYFNTDKVRILIIMKLLENIFFVILHGQKQKQYQLKYYIRKEEGLFSLACLLFHYFLRPKIIPQFPYNQYILFIF